MWCSLCCQFLDVPDEFICFEGTQSGDILEVVSAQLHKITACDAF
jgi:hypothetical protein